MNKIPSRDYFIECRRGPIRRDALEYPQYVQESRMDASTIYRALIDPRRPRPTNALSLFNATQVPPVSSLVCPASLGSSALMIARSRTGIGKEPMDRTLPKQLERGVWYEA
jgi:hypothetical protein